MLFKKGGIPWNKGTKGVMKAWNKGLELKKTHPQMGYQIGHKFFEGSEKGWFKKGESANPATQFKKGHTPWVKGKIGIHAGSKNPCWRGGLAFRKTNEHKHQCSKYVGWMLEVKKRDNWKCKIEN